MSLAGVRSSRGDTYQVCVAMDWAIRMIKEPRLIWMELDSTRVISGGIPAPVDDIILGWESGDETCCQCKKNEPGFTAWKVTEIEDDLKKAAEHLMAEPKVLVRFYSRADFGDLGRLIDRARQMPDLAAFQSSFPNTPSPELAKLEAAWQTSLAKGTHDIHALLQRISVNPTRSVDDYSAYLKLDLAQLVTRVDDAYNTLWTTLDNLGARTAEPWVVADSHRVTRNELLQLLQDKGCSISPPRVQAEIESRLKSMSQIGRGWRREIAGKRVERKAVAELLDAIETKSSVLLTDGPGAGKTCVLLELIDKLELRNDTAMLFLQARDFADAADQDGRVALGLDPDIPALVSAMSQWKRVVVVVDSLDVLSLNRETECLTFFLNLIDRLKTIPDVCVVVACRSFDLHYNRQLASRKWDEQVEAGLLDWNTMVEPILHELSVDTASLDAPTRDLLGNPRNLALFADIAAKSTRNSLSSAQELTDIYLDVVVAADMNLGTPAMVAIEGMAKEMLTYRRHQLQRGRVQVDDGLLLRLRSANVLFVSDRGDVGFGHQTLLDALAVREAVRRGLSLLEFIRSQQPVPFIRPAIRAFFTHLRVSERASFGGQLRAVFESDVAFHIKRLIAESYAACEPDDGDWNLIRHIFRKHPEHFRSIYEAGRKLAWHHFWMRHFVPMLEVDGNADWLDIHFDRIREWSNDDPVGVFAYWTRFAASSHAKDKNLRAKFRFVVRGFKHLAEVDAQPLLEAVVGTPSTGHDFLGDVLLQWANHDPRGDTLLWRYITAYVPQAPTREREIEATLQCGQSSFTEIKALTQRLTVSEVLLDLAVSSLEVWGKTLALSPHTGSGAVADKPNNEFRDQTSFSHTHSNHQIRHVSSLARLVQAIEAAILQRASAHDDWWKSNALRVCLNDCGALRYIGTLVMTKSPEVNSDSAKQFFADDHRARLTDKYELGNLIAAIAPFLGDSLELVESHIFQRLQEHYTTSSTWVDQERYELLSRIPAHLRSAVATEYFNRMTSELAPPNEQPRLYSTSGYISAPYKADQLTSLSDNALITLLIDSQTLGRGPQIIHELMGGADSVDRLLHSTASSQPRRFLKLLVAGWTDLPDVSKRSIFGGATDYLRFRYGNVHASHWQAKEDIELPELLELLLTELERHPQFWTKSREGAAAVACCASLVTEPTHVERVVFMAPAQIMAEDPPCGERPDDDLISTAISSSRGELAEGLLSLVNRLTEQDRALPPMLPPALKRLAEDCHPAVRAVIVRGLAYLQTKSELGWDLFDAAFSDEDQRVWKHAENTLYHATGLMFGRAKQYLNRMENSELPGVLKSWGRLSALAELNGHIPLDILIEKLVQGGQEAAWHGAISVWVANAGNIEYASDCFAGLAAAVPHAAAHPALQRRMGALFQSRSPTPRIPLSLFRAVYVNSEVSLTEDGQLIPNIDDWLSRCAEIDPDQALEISEIVANVCKARDTTPFFEPAHLGTLLTSLFREAEEREASDGGDMLRRVVTLQDVFLSLRASTLSEWLHSAERPDI